MTRPEGVPLRAALGEAARRLAAAGIEAARFEARVLAAAAIGCEPADVLLHLDRRLSPEEAERLAELVERRAARLPVAYVLGWADFYGRRFRVTPDVLVPRPETELLVDAVLEACRGQGRAGDARGGAAEGEGLELADLGTGSGAIAVTLAAELPGCRVWATDVSPAALAVARANAERHGVADRVRFLLGDWAAPLLAAGLHGRLQAVVSNPPYVAPEEVPALPPEVQAEPQLAIVAPGHALAAYEALLPQAVPLLRPGGMLVLEVAPHRAADVAALVERSGPWTRVEVRRDYAGLERVLVAWR